MGVTGSALLNGKLKSDGSGGIMFEQYRKLSDVRNLSQLIDVHMFPLWQVHNSFSKILLSSVAFQDALVAEYHEVI